MQAVYREGRVRAIGVSDFQHDRLMDLIVHHEVVPAVSQFETHSFNQQVETRAFLQENGVRIASWGSFEEGKHGSFQNEVLREIAEKHGKTAAQNIFRWLIQPGVVAIPKLVRPNRMAENFAVLDVDLTRPTWRPALDTKTSSFFYHRGPAIVKELVEAEQVCNGVPIATDAGSPPATQMRSDIASRHRGRDLPCALTFLMSRVAHTRAGTLGSILGLI